MSKLTDDDAMPFGKYSRKPDGPRAMKDVPASYLLWLFDEDVKDVRVRSYIMENFHILREECPDYIPPDERTLDDKPC